MTTTVGKTGNYYYGARYYDPKVSVWLSVDPKAYAFPSVTPYSFMMNNPVMMIDPGGDSTLYVNAEGETLHTSHDRLENSVIVVENEEAFRNELEKYKEEELSDPFLRDEINGSLREFGQNYDINGIKEFYLRTIDQNDWEHANYLYLSDGMIRVGSQSHDFTDKSKKGVVILDNKTAVGSIHQHEWHRLSAHSSSFDRNSHFDDTKYRDVIVSGRGSISFLNSNIPGSKEFKIPFRNTFKK